MAHKYIKKYKVNGKWRYVYADSKTHDSINMHKKLAKHNLDEVKFLTSDPSVTINNKARAEQSLGMGGQRARAKLAKDESPDERMIRMSAADAASIFRSVASSYGKEARQASSARENLINKNSVSTKVKNAGSTTLSSIKNTGSKIKSTVTRRKKK